MGHLLPASRARRGGGRKVGWVNAGPSGRASIASPSRHSLPLRLLRPFTPFLRVAAVAVFTVRFAFGPSFCSSCPCLPAPFVIVVLALRGCTLDHRYVKSVDLKYAVAGRWVPHKSVEPGRGGRGGRATRSGRSRSSGASRQSRASPGDAPFCRGSHRTRLPERIARPPRPPRPGSTDLCGTQRPATAYFRSTLFT